MGKKRKPKSLRKWIRRQKAIIRKQELGKYPGCILKWKKNKLYCINIKGEKKEIREISI